ncbi:MAG: DUF4157 domain-containing protein [Candidatus Eremiobacteraeota bacterium]|nr:DUF4157 domain-containing protein [Candidatus Eremiobacteraeota bacterium]
MAYEPLERRPVNVRPNGLPAQLQAGIHAMTGHDVSGVTVNRNSSLPAQVGALAYTQGTNIHLGPGQDHHLAHEAYHVVQQMENRVPVTTSVNGAPVNDNPSLEHEASVNGEKANALGTHALQRLTDDDEIKKT